MPAEDLQLFFDESIRQDNFDGLGQLVAVIDKAGTDTSAWDLNQFRSAVDFYLNHSFDLSKLLTFTRLYIRGMSDRVKANPGDFEKTFGQVESLVDMNAMFSFLVDKVGKRTL